MVCLVLVVAVVRVQAVVDDITNLDWLRLMQQSNTYTTTITPTTNNKDNHNTFQLNGTNSDIVMNEYQPKEQTQIQTDASN